MCTGARLAEYRISGSSIHEIVNIATNGNYIGRISGNYISRISGGRISGQISIRYNPTSDTTLQVQILRRVIQGVVNCATRSDISDNIRQIVLQNDLLNRLLNDRLYETPCTLLHCFQVWDTRESRPCETVYCDPNLPPGLVSWNPNLPNTLLVAARTGQCIYKYNCVLEGVNKNPPMHT